MGGIQTKNTSETLIENIINNVSEETFKCDSSINQSTNINIGKTKGNVVIDGLNVDQESTLTLQCILNSENKKKLDSVIENSIQQFLKSQSQAVLSSLSRENTDNEQILKNKIENSTKNIRTTEISTIIKQETNLDVNDVEGDVIIRSTSLSQSAKLLVKGILESKDVNDIIQSVSNSADQVAKSEQKTVIDSFTSLIATIGLIPLLIMCGVVLFLLLGGKTLISTISSGASSVGGITHFTKNKNFKI